MFKAFCLGLLAVLGVGCACAAGALATRGAESAMRDPFANRALASRSNDRTAPGDTEAGNGHASRDSIQVGNHCGR